MDQDAMNYAMREAIAQAISPYVTMDDFTDACASVLTAVKARLLADLPALMEHSYTRPENVAVLNAAIVVPLLQEIEDGLNDDQTDTKTHHRYLPGLRRAASFVREIRRTIADNTAGQEPK